MTSVKPHIALFVLFGTAYLLLLGPFLSYMQSKPVEEKLGYVPSIKVVRPLSVDHKELVGAALVMKVMMYYGGLTDKQQSNVITDIPDYQTMSRMLFGATTLDPYNLDVYYFAQAFLVWDAKQVPVANQLLEHGMKYRTWDWSLPFFAAFNNAYFLKDFAKAAYYYRLAGDLSGQELHVSLSSRYMQEAGQTDHAIAYLQTMLRSTRNKTVQTNLETRLRALEAVQVIEKAEARYREMTGSTPVSVKALVDSGFLDTVPVDPYGGTFYIEPGGKVSTTSRFAFKSKSQGKM